MRKKSGFKYQIEQKLLSVGFVIIEIGSSDNWWEEERWKIQSRYDQKVLYYIYFIIDPQSESLRDNSPHIYEVRASLMPLTNWNDDSNMIASITMSKGHFEIKLNKFTKDIQSYRLAT